MSASRTLLRKITKERVELPDGSFIYADRKGRPRAIKRGTPNRRVTPLFCADPCHEHTFHATKGHRWTRIPERAA